MVTTIRPGDAAATPLSGEQCDPWPRYMITLSQVPESVSGEGRTSHGLHVTQCESVRGRQWIREHVILQWCGHRSGNVSLHKSLQSDRQQHLLSVSFSSPASSPWTQVSPSAHSSWSWSHAPVSPITDQTSPQVSIITAQVLISPQAWSWVQWSRVPGSQVTSHHVDNVDQWWTGP